LRSFFSSDITTGVAAAREKREKVREILEELSAAVWAEEWKGRARLTARSVYVALLASRITTET
jgi:hypothetical protein